MKYPLFTVLFLACCYFAQAQGKNELTIFDQQGKPYAYLAPNHTVYAFSGEQLANLIPSRVTKTKVVVGNYGHFLGWFAHGLFFTQQQKVAGFTRNAAHISISLPIQLPRKAPKQLNFLISPPTEPANIAAPVAPYRWVSPDAFFSLFSSEPTIFDHRGSARAYITKTGDIYLFSGKLVAYVRPSQQLKYFRIFSANGTHTGWYTDGVFFTEEGKVAGFTKNAPYVKVRPSDKIPARQPKLLQLKPLREFKSQQVLKPLKNYRWLAWEDFFEFDREQVIFDKKGVPRAYIARFGKIFLFSGKLIARLKPPVYKNVRQVVSGNGTPLGWLAHQVFFNQMGKAGGFLRGASNIKIKPLPNIPKKDRKQHRLQLIKEHKTPEIPLLPTSNFTWILFKELFATGD